jgi:hypothetical protein
MSRFIDDLRRKDAHIAKPWWVAPRNEQWWKEHVTAVIGLLDNRELPVLLIDNVADYYFTCDQEHWDIQKDFPNLAPPFPRFWLEHKLPRKIHSAEKGDTDVASFVQGRVGILMTAVQAQDEHGNKIVPDDARWMYYCELFVDYGIHGVTAYGGHGAIWMPVDADGRCTEPPGMLSFAEDERENPVMQAIMSWIKPALLAISFLHCKNVTLVENTVPKPLAKKYRARTGVEPAAYKTLVIEPLKAILRTEGRSGEHGLQKALHICRGHFRDYREGRGLFGKYHQLVWVPSIVRGTKGEKAPPREIEVKV